MSANIIGIWGKHLRSADSAQDDVHYVVLVLTHQTTTTKQHSLLGCAVSVTPDR
jgi:hypothetical protein